MSALNTYVATTGVLRLRLRIDHRTNVAVIWFWYKRTMGKIRAYHRYGYGRTTGTLRAYYRHGYGRTTDTATGVPQTWIGRTTGTATGVPQTWLRAYYDCGYGRTYGRTTLTFLLRIPYVCDGNYVLHVPPHMQVVTFNSVHSSAPAEDSAMTWALPPTLDYANVTNTSVLLTAAFPDLATPIQQIVLQQVRVWCCM